ncbi:T9SS type A sorting domain-containing protein [candidate division KSB1 bacterium]|nr:T9SS type A sorting domain-containing protein [candidate division KSB1 bacterium]
MIKKVLWSVSTIVLFMIVVANAALVDPLLVEGNPKCADITLGTTEFKIEAEDLVSGKTYSLGDGRTITVSVTETRDSEDIVFNWSSNFPMNTVIVKGSNGANIYDYTTLPYNVLLDSGLHPPENASGKWAAISHINFCYKKTETHLKIIKQVNGVLDTEAKFEFPVTRPDNTQETVYVTVPAGTNPNGSFQILTMPGPHIIDEQPHSDYDPVDNPHREIMVVGGGTTTVTFTNKPKETEQGLKIIKIIQGTTATEGTFEFEVTKPDGSKETVYVTVPAGTDNQGEMTINTVPGTHNVKEQPKSGWDPVGPDEKQVEVVAGETAEVTFTNKPTSPPEQTIKIIKTILGDLDQPLTIDFELAKPDGTTEIVQVTVPPGTNSSGSNEVPTQAGKNTVTEPDIPGYNRVSPKSGIKIVDVPVGGTGIAEFVNEKEPEIEKIGCVDGYYSDGRDPMTQENMVLKNVVTNELRFDRINPANGYYKFHKVPLGTYIVYPEGHEEMAKQVVVWKIDQSQCTTRNFSFVQGCPPVFAWYHENDFKSVELDTPLVGFYNTRDPVIYEYDVLLAERLNIDAYLIRLDELMESVCGDSCNKVYKTSIIKGIMEKIEKYMEFFPDFQLRVIAVWDLEYGELEENLALFKLLADSILTHPAYYGVTAGERKPIFFLQSRLTAQPMELQAFAQHWISFREIVDTYLYPHKITICVDIDPFLSPAADWNSINQYVDAIYPRLDLSDYFQAPWLINGHETGYQYLQNFYKTIKQLGLKIDVGSTWPGHNDKFWHPLHYTIDANGDTVFNYVDKLEVAGQFLTQDSTWLLAFSYSPSWLIIESMNNYNEVSNISPSTLYKNKVTMDAWEKINRRKGDCYIWEGNETALEFLYHWYRAVKSGRFHQSIIDNSIELFFMEEYDAAIDLITPLPDNFALQFDGVDDIVQIAHDPKLNIHDQMTIEFWIETSSSTQFNTRILEKGVWDEYSMGFYGATGRIGGALRIDLNDNNSRMKTLIGPSKTHIQDNTWYHVAATYDGAKANLFINGELEVSNPASLSARREIGDLIVGAVKKATGYSSFFKGTIDDLRFWSIAKTAAQVRQQMYNELLGDEAGLVACYQFNEAQGQFAHDETANKFDGQLGISANAEASDPQWVLSDRPYSKSGNTNSNEDKKIESYEINWIPQKPQLLQNYPNPFNAQTTIEYHLSQESTVLLTIYDVMGRKVTILVHERKNPGEYRVDWNTTGIPSGIYFYNIKAGDFVQTKRLVLLK